MLLSRAYAWFGLVGVGLFGTLLTVAVAYAVYWMVRRLSGKFWVACILATVSCSAFLFSLMPRPVFLSMILFAVTLTLLLESQRTGRVQVLYWLPLGVFGLGELPHSVYLRPLRRWACSPECICSSN